MLKKIFIISIIVAALLAAAFIGYQQIKAKSLFEETDLYLAVSSDAGIIVETKNIMTFSKAFLYENNLSKEIEFLGNFQKLIENVDLLFTKHPDLQANADRQTVFSYQILSEERKACNLLAIKTTNKETKKAIELIRETIFPDKKIETTKYNKTTLYHFPDNTTGQSILVCAHIHGIFLLSSYQDEIQSAIDRINGTSESLGQYSDFISIKNTAGKNALGNIFVQTNKILPLLNKTLNKNQSLFSNNLKSFPGWLALDINLSDEQILVNGYSAKNDEFSKAILFEQEPVEGNLYYKLPMHTAFFTHYGISNYDLFAETLTNGQINVTFERSFSFIKNHFSGEVVKAFTNQTADLQKGTFVMFTIKDSTLFTEELEVKTKRLPQYSPYTLKKIAIYELPQQNSLTAAFGDFATLSGTEFVAIQGNNVLVSPSAELTTELAGLLFAGFTLEKDKAFMSASESFDSKSNVLSYLYFPSLLKFAKEIFTSDFAGKLEKQKEQLSKIQTLGWQMENERGLIYHNAFIKSGQIDSSTIEIPSKKTNRLIWAADFESKPVFGPVIVKNQRTGTEEILLQDDKNVLHFYTHDGNEGWSLQLESPILGSEMQQIDFYKNKRYQFIFNTAQKLHVVDRLGRMVENFPINLPSEASAPLAVFDYDAKLDYRIFIPAKNKNIYLYKKDGTRPADWEFKQTQNEMTLPVQYFRFDDKDYLIVNDGVKIRILDRRGRDRINLKSTFEPSVNPIFFLTKAQNNKPVFMATDKQGYIKMIYLDGTVHSTKISGDLTAAHHFIMTQVSQTPVFIFVDGNTLSIYNRDFKNIFVKHFEENDFLPNLSGKWLTLFSSEAKNARILELNQLDIEKQNFPTNSKPAVGTLKPMPKTYVLTIDDGKILCYELN
jgi:hypothetical protein